MHPTINIYAYDREHIHYIDYGALAGDSALYNLKSEDPNDDEYEEVDEWKNTNNAEG